MSLRTRLILSYLLIVIICLGIAGVSVSVILQSYSNQASLTRLDDATHPINIQIRTLLRSPNTTIVDIWTNVQDLAQNNDVYILFVDTRGTLLRQASPGSAISDLSVSNGFPHGFSQSSHGVFTTSTGQNFIYSAYPLIRTVDSQSPKAEAIIFCQPQSNAAVILTGVVPPFVLAGLVALVISLVLAFFMARSVYRPIHNLSKAAGNIAKGHYDESVPVTGTDEVRRLALSFNEMAAKVKESQQQLRHFVADVSHQLKSPLTSIQGFAQAILDGTAADEETRLKATRIIVEESKRMIRQVNELLELSRMQAGQVKMAKEPVDIKELLWHCQEIFTLRLEEKNITLKDLTESSAMAIGDADRLEDVFCNLLDNAIKNTPVHGEIHLITRHHDQMLEVTVADNGPGIPPEQIPYVFERFQQSSGLRSGFGLGLAIAREIILAHGGKIEVSSNPGEGAQFMVTLPLLSS